MGPARRRLLEPRAQLGTDERNAGFEFDREVGLADEVLLTDISKADSLILRGDSDAALALLDEMADSQDPSFELADFLTRLHRLRGEALTRRGDFEAANVCLEIC